MNVIFGAFGRTGRIVAELVERDAGAPVRRVTRGSKHAGGNVVTARMSDDAELAAVLKGARAVYAILPDDLRAEAFHAERRAMAEALARAIARERVPRVVLLSSTTAALGEQGQHGFGVELAYFERLVLDTAACVTVLRASYFQDNVAQLLPGPAQDGLFPNFFASKQRAFPTIATRDVGAFAAQCLLQHPEREREIVDLSGPSYSTAEMAKIAEDVLGRPLTVVDVPAAAREQAFASWMSAEAAKAMVETLDCIGAGRAPALGERTLRGGTRLEQVLEASLSHAPHAAVEVRA